MTPTKKLTRAAVAAATAEAFILSGHESVANGKEAKEDYEILDRE